MSTPSPNPRRVAAGKRNRLLRRGLSEIGRTRLRLSALMNQPWLRATGPRTASGKARAAGNGKVRQLDLQSVRERRAELAAARETIRSMRELRKIAGQ